MKLISKTLRDKGQQIISVEEFFYNSNKKIIRQDYKDDKNNLKFYKMFEYDDNGNLCNEVKFSASNVFQGSNEYKCDKLGNQIQQIVRTIGGSIYEWYENFEVPEKNLKIYLSKDENGKVIHKTNENLLDHSEQRFNEQGKLYEIYKRKFDAVNRLIEEMVTMKKGKKKERIFTLTKIKTVFGNYF